MKNLEELRGEIDSIDRKIVELFEKRMELVSEVSDYKVKHKLPILNSLREGQVVERNLKGLKNRQLERYLEEFYLNLMDISKRYQKDKSDMIDRKL